MLEFLGALGKILRLSKGNSFQFNRFIICGNPTFKGQATLTLFLKDKPFGQESIILKPIFI